MKRNKYGYWSRPPWPCLWLARGKESPIFSTYGGKIYTRTHAITTTSPLNGAVCLSCRYIVPDNQKQELARFCPEQFLATFSGSTGWNYSNGTSYSSGNVPGRTGHQWRHSIFFFLFTSGGIQLFVSFFFFTSGGIPCFLFRPLQVGTEWNFY